MYRAHDRQLDRDVAIKVPHVAASGTGSGTSDRAAAKLIDEFLQEARRLAQLKHPGIVTVLDVDAQDGKCLIVSEFLDGQNLNEWMVDRAVSWQEASRIVAEISDALAYAHSQSTVHRDLKPGNIILVQRADGLRPVLVDFGLALSDSATAGSQRGVIAGTPNYMSPEQARGAARHAAAWMLLSEPVSRRWSGATRKWRFSKTCGSRRTTNSVRLSA